MTEDEARTKWCPHTRVWQISGTESTSVAYNRTESELSSYTNPSRARCIASDCMMWESTEELFGVPPDEYYETDGDCGLKRKIHD